VNHQCPKGAQGRGLSLMRDHGWQPTALVFMKACSALGIHQALTRDNNPKGNADTERVMRTLKAACLWLQEWTRPVERVKALASWIVTSHEHDLHSTLGSKTPG
jgi:putative transposase